jgi:HD-GYP domain-containing protein (c-di-GMP phosphodiesterase class II)
MTSKRAYHDPYLPSEVLEYIMGRSGMEFDPEVVKTMVWELCVYPVGCEVELSNGEYALVVENHKGYSLRPTVKMIKSGRIIDLTSDRNAWNLTIVKLLI